jgi:urease subunit beta
MGLDTGGIELNVGRKTVSMSVTGDRPIQAGSRCDFFENNPALKFKRARGMHRGAP